MKVQVNNKQDKSMGVGESNMLEAQSSGHTEVNMGQCILSQFSHTYEIIKT